MSTYKLLTVYCIWILFECARASQQNVWYQNQREATELRYESKTVEFPEKISREETLKYSGTAYFNKFQQQQKRKSESGDPLLNLLDGLKFEHKGGYKISIESNLRVFC